MAEFLSSDPKIQDAHPHTVYDLVANICHDGQAGAGKGTYRVHLRHKVCSYYTCDWSDLIGCVLRVPISGLSCRILVLKIYCLK